MESGDSLDSSSPSSSSQSQSPSVQTGDWGSIQDKSSQTDERHIAEIKAMERGVGELVSGTRELEKELNLVKHLLIAKFQSQLRTRSEDLSSACELRLSQLEARHSQQLDALRGSVKTQLRDGLHLIAGEYRRYYEEITSGEEKGQEAKLSLLRRENTSLIERVTQLESELLVARREKEQLRAESEEASLRGQEQQLQPWEQADPAPSQDRGGLSEEEGRRLGTEVGRLEGQVLELQEQVREKERLCRKLEGKVDSVKTEVQREKKERERVEKEFQTFKRRAAESNVSASAESSKERERVQQEAREEMERAKEEAGEQTQVLADEIRMKERAKMQVEVKKVQEELDKVRAERDKLLQQDYHAALKESEEREKQYKSSIHSLNKDLTRSTRTWTKKVQILEAHLHAVKDESYVRHSLERKASSLHQATLSYAADADSNSQPVYPALPCTLGTLCNQRY